MFAVTPQKANSARTQIKNSKHHPPFVYSIAADWDRAVVGAKKHKLCETHNFSIACRNFSIHNVQNLHCIACHRQSYRPTTLASPHFLLQCSSVVAVKLGDKHQHKKKTTFNSILFLFCQRISLQNIFVFFFFILRLFHLNLCNFSLIKRKQWEEKNKNLFDEVKIIG